MVKRGGLENRLSERARGFESHPLRLRKTTNQNDSVVFLCRSWLGEVPKWLKGLPWKGSRSLIAVRGFKSLLLRLFSGNVKC